MTKAKTIYDLALHETIFISTALQVLRVVGGWIYTITTTTGMTSTFVPYEALAELGDSDL